MLSFAILLFAVAAFAPVASAQFSVNPGSLNFGSVPLNTQVSQSFTVTNTSNGNLSGSVTALLLGVSASPGLFGPLKPGQSATITVTVDTSTPGLNAGQTYSGQVAVQAGGTSKGVTVTFTVVGVQVQLTAAPASQTINVTAGQMATGAAIRITAQGGTPTPITASSSGPGVTISGSGNTFTPVADATNVMFSLPYTIAFTCSVCNTTTVSVTVNVNQPNSNGPTINSFSASPSTISAGQSSTLSWSISNATSVTIDHGIGAVNAQSGSISVQPSTTTTYTINASNGATSTSSTATVTVGSNPVSTTKIIPQIADGGPWQTTLVVVNRGSTTANASLGFSMDVPGGGTPTAWAVQMENNYNYGSMQVPPHSAIWMRTADPANANTTTGYATLTADPNVEAFAIFRQRVSGIPDQEGTANALGAANRVLVPFDNTGGHASAIAIVNSGLSSQTISVTALTSAGVSTQDSLTLPAQGHIAIQTSAQFPETTGTQGVLVLSNPNGAPFTALALRFNGSSFTTIPVFPTVSAGGTAILSQIADGGGWQSTVVVVNTGATSATARLSFSQDLAGGVSGPWTPSLNGQVISSVSLSPNGSVFLQTPGSSNAASFVQGYATVMGDPGIQAFAIFRQRVSGIPDQEGTAVASSATSEVLVPFDNTGGSVSTAAIVNTGQTQTFMANYGGSQSPIMISGGAHIPFLISNQVSSAANQRSLIDFTSSGSAFSMLGLRFNSTGAFTSLPTFSAGQ